MYEFEEDKVEEPEKRVNTVQNWPELFVRVIGIILLLVGLWASVHVLLEALRLYRDPLRIEQLASAIERGSNLDQTLQQNVYDESGKSSARSNNPGLTGQGAANGIRLTYFIAWIVALLLLMLIAMIAFSAIRAGSELVLQDGKLKGYLKGRVKELEKRGNYHAD